MPGEGPDSGPPAERSDKDEVQINAIVAGVREEARREKILLLSRVK